MKRETYIGELISADFEEKTMEFEIQSDFIVQKGKCAIVPIEEYNKLIETQQDKDRGEVSDVEHHCNNTMMSKDEQRFFLKGYKFAINHPPTSETEVRDEQIEEWMKGKL